ncbi:MAG: hypothetical protein P1U46_00170 [Patescibacteria group bacterium]|nr:hypothetical protein [Patescibacteria group bacterium]
MIPIYINTATVSIVTREKISDLNQDNILVTTSIQSSESLICTILLSSCHNNASCIILPSQKTL